MTSHIGTPSSIIPPTLTLDDFYWQRLPFAPGPPQRQIPPGRFSPPSYYPPYATPIPRFAYEQQQPPPIPTAQPPQQPPAPPLPTVPILPTSTELKGFVAALSSIPRFLYISTLFFLPFFYRSRVYQIFIEVSMTENEIIALYAGGAHPQSIRPKHWETVKRSWNDFIDSVLKEWNTLNIVSVLLLTAIYNILELGGSGSRLVQCTAIMSLISALMSLIFGCMFVIRFETMRRPYKAMQWARDALDKSRNIWWNVFVLLALPFVWLAWSLVLFIICLMAVIWQTPGHETNVHGFPRLSLDVQIIVSVFLFLGIVYLYLIIVTFSRYDSIDKKWSERLGQMRHSAIANAQYDYSYPTWAGYAPATAAGAAIPSDSNPELRLSTTHLPPPNHSRQAGMNSIPNPSHSRQSSTAQTTTNPARTRSHRRRSSQDLSPLPYPQTGCNAFYSKQALTSHLYLLPSPYRATPSPPSPAAYYRSQVPSKPQPPPLFPIAEGEGQEPSASADAHQPSPMVTRQRSSTHQLPVTASYTPEQDQPDRSFSGDSQHQQQQSGSSEHSHYSTNEGQVSDLPNSSPTAFPPDHIEALVPVDTTADDVEKQLDIPHPGPSLGSGPGSPSQSSTLRPGTPQLFSPPPSYLIPNSITGQSWWRNPSPNRITRDWDPVVRDGDKEEETEGETKREREREMERGRGRERDALDPSEYPGPGPYTFSPPEVMTRSVSLPAVPVSAQPSSSSNQPMGSTSTSSPDPAPAPGLNSSRSPSRGDADRDQDVPGINITGFSGTRQEEDADSQDGVSPLELYAINPISRETSTPVSAHTARVQFDTESEEQEH